MIEVELKNGRTFRIDADYDTAVNNLRRVRQENEFITIDKGLLVDPNIIIRVEDMDNIEPEYLK